jgi:lipase maturation factor 1
MLEWAEAAAKWLFAPEVSDERRPGHLWPRWIFLRALGLIYFSAFYSLLFQIKGLLGPAGILPAGDYLQAVSAQVHPERFWVAPTLLWLGSSDHALMLLVWVGLIASVLLVLNLWPRAMLLVCFAAFLSFVAAARDFSGYQSDGMLLQAGFAALFFAPAGFLPGLGHANPPSRFSRFLVLFEWFSIYFESGVAKIRSGDLSWRNFTAMDDYYQNGPLPTWIGWHVQQFPHWFHAFTAFLTLAVELGLVWLAFLPFPSRIPLWGAIQRRLRIIVFCIVTPFEIGIILTANYCFLNYIVLSLGFLLLDDRAIEWVVPVRLRKLIERETAPIGVAGVPEGWRARWRKGLAPLRVSVSAICMSIVFYAAAVQMSWMLPISLPFPEAPVRYLEPFRIANRYGLFAVMTHERYEIEFQGSRDGKTWIPYLFRYKPQDATKAPGIFAPYQPRFEWNLWFASLGSWRENRFVVWTEERLLRAEPDVLELFAANPFAGGPPPTEVRAVVYQYWFTDRKTRREHGVWWRRELLGQYAPTLESEPNGRIGIVDSQLADPMRE